MLNRTNSVSNFSPANGGTLIAASANAGGWSDRSLINADKNNFAPRFGFSYQPSEKVVFRGGYGIFYQFLNRIGSESQLALNQPFLKAVQTSQTSGSVTPVFQLKNGFPGAAVFGLRCSIDSAKKQLAGSKPAHQLHPAGELWPAGTTQLKHGNGIDMGGNWGRKMNRLRNANQGVVTGFSTPTQAIVQFPYANLNTSTTAIAGTGTHSFLEYRDQ